MKLWEKGINPEPAIIEFTAGKDRKTDLALTKWDIIGSMAHVIMLEDVRLISEDENIAKYRRFKPLVLKDFFEYQVRIESEGTDYAWQILSVGSNSTLSQNNPTTIIK